MFVLFKNVNVNGDVGDVAVSTSDIQSVTNYPEHGTLVMLTDNAPSMLAVSINLPIEVVVGLINQALGQTSFPDQPEKSVIVIEGN